MELKTHELTRSSHDDIDDAEFFSDSDELTNEEESDMESDNEEKLDDEEDDETDDEL